MVVAERDIKDTLVILENLQIFSDNQIRSRDMSLTVANLRGASSQRAIKYLEGLVGKGNVNNKNLRKVLNSMHDFMVSASKSGLGIHGEETT